MNYQEFVDTYKGKATDYDGVAGVQCVDLIKLYLDKVFGLKPGAWGDAHSYYDQWTTYTKELENNFTRIPNTPSFIPKKGDIMVWGTNEGGGAGHVAICTGVGDTTYFYSYDQNWGTSAMTMIKHDYTHVLGVLRAKDQTKITGTNTGKTTLAMGTLWVDGDTYIFNRDVSEYSSTSMTKVNNELKKGNQRKFTKFVIVGTRTFGRTTAGTYIIVNENGTLTVDAYATVDCDVLNVRKSHSTSSEIVGTVSNGQTFLMTKAVGDWAYAPDVSGWLYLGYMKA